MLFKKNLLEDIELDSVHFLKSVYVVDRRKISNGFVSNAQQFSDLSPNDSFLSVFKDRYFSYM